MKRTPEECFMSIFHNPSIFIRRLSKYRKLRIEKSIYLIFFLHFVPFFGKLRREALDKEAWKFLKYSQLTTSY